MEEACTCDIASRRIATPFLPSFVAPSSPHPSECCPFAGARTTNAAILTTQFSLLEIPKTSHFHLLLDKLRFVTPDPGHLSHRDSTNQPPLIRPPTHSPTLLIHHRKNGPNNHRHRDNHPSGHRRTHTHFLRLTSSRRRIIRRYTLRCWVACCKNNLNESITCFMHLLILLFFGLIVSVDSEIPPDPTSRLPLYNFRLLPDPAHSHSDS